MSSSTIDWSTLEKRAAAVRLRAHAPYSKYLVGAALQTASGEVFAGCNVENASYGLALCAERSAIAAMVAAGQNTPIAIVVVTNGPEPGAPCGMCRQVLAEFAEDLAVKLSVVDDPSKDRMSSLEALLPDAFRPRHLGASGPPNQGDD